MASDLLNSLNRHLDLAQTQDELVQKMIKVGKPADEAVKYATKQSLSNLAQVSYDLLRTANIHVVLQSLPEDSIDRIINVNELDFTDHASVDNFLSLVSSQNPQIQSYLEAYLHQGGFTNLAETLLFSYFMENKDPMQNIMLETDNRKSTFIINSDGSLTFEEQFEISKLKRIVQGEQIEYSSDKDSIATVTLKSHIHVKQNADNESDISHTFEDIQIKAHDNKAAKKIFNDPRNPLVQFMDWFKSVIQSIFDQRTLEQNRKLKEIPTAKLKL